MEQNNIPPRSTNEGTGEKRVTNTDKQDLKEIGSNVILNFYKFLAETCICTETISECSEVKILGEMCTL